MASEKKIVADDLHIRVHPGLRRLVLDAADEADVSVNEVIAKILADHFEKPELGIVPRGRIGRPPIRRKELAGK